MSRRRKCYCDKHGVYWGWDDEDSDCPACEEEQETGEEFEPTVDEPDEDEPDYDSEFGGADIPDSRY
jgi:hypothetical protein